MNTKASFYNYLGWMLAKSWLFAFDERTKTKIISNEYLKVNNNFVKYTDQGCWQIYADIYPAVFLLYLSETDNRSMLLSQNNDFTGRILYLLVMYSSKNRYWTTIVY